MSGALLALLLLATPAAQPPGLQLFPVQGVFFPSDDQPNRIDPDFREALGDAGRAYFAEAFRARFPQAAATISQANVRRTYAVSLQVARAARYAVPKADGNTDVLLPVTASLYFSNVATGEVLYAATRTTIQPAKLSPTEAAAGSAQVRGLFAQTFRSVVDDLLGDAAERFRPTVLSVKVAGAWKGLAVLSGGKADGLARGDELLGAGGGILQILSVASDYAVATGTKAGDFAVGESFTKFSNGTLADVRKHRVLPLVELTPDGYPEAAVVQLFSDALGANAPVALVPVNPTHGEVVRAIRTQIDLSGEKLLQRQLPNFFVRLRVPEPVMFERPTNLDFKTVRVTASLAYADLVDRSGRVLFTAVGRDRIEEEITGGMALAPAARREVGVKNALLDLAKVFGKTLKLESARLPVLAGGDQIVVKDAQGLLLPGASLRAYRAIGKVDGIAGEVWVPTWEVEVREVGADTATAAAVLPMIADAPAIQEGQLLMLDGVAHEGPRRLRFGDCAAQGENLGGPALPDATRLAQLLFAAGSRQPFYATGLKARVEALVRSGAGFAEDLRFTEPKVDYCVQPVFRVQPEPQKCDGTACADVAKLLAGYRIRAATAAGEVKAKTGLEARMTAAALPGATPGDTREAALRADLLDEFLKLSPSTAAAIGDKKL